MSAPSRRELLQGAAAFALTQLVRVTPASALPLAPRGFCPAPQTELEHTLFALAETIVPGSRTDPSGAPGASDVCALGDIPSAHDHGASAGARGGRLRARCPRQKCCTGRDGR